LFFFSQHEEIIDDMTSSIVSDSERISSPASTASATTHQTHISPTSLYIAEEPDPSPNVVVDVVSYAAVLSKNARGKAVEPPSSPVVQVDDTQLVPALTPDKAVLPVEHVYEEVREVRNRLSSLVLDVAAASGKFCVTESFYLNLFWLAWIFCFLG
jgi:hypothetical protein